MPFNLLGAGAGAGVGLESLLARLRQEEDDRQKWSYQQQELAQRGRIADMTNARQLEINQINAGVRRDALQAQIADQQAAEAARAENTSDKTLALYGPSEDFDPQTYENIVKANPLTAGLFTKVPGPRVTQTQGIAALPQSAPSGLSTLPMQAPVTPAEPSTTTTDVSSPLNAPSRIRFAGTEAARLARQREIDAASKQPASKGLQHLPLMFAGNVRMGTYDPESGGYSIAGQDVTNDPRLTKPPEGSPVAGITILQGPTGPIRVDKRGGTAQPVVDADGNPIGPPSSAAERQRAIDIKTSLTTLDRLDADITAADKAGVIGPLGGRVADYEAYVGSPDPQVSILATRMMLAKQKMESGIGGMRAAASPQLLARWDNLLASKMTGQNLHAVVQVMRDMMKDAGAATPAYTGNTPEGTEQQIGGFKVRIH
jgi:hypothetical protein